MSLNKIRIKVTLLCAILLGTLISIGCKEAEPKFTLLVSGNAHGLVDPCDCELGHLGGLAKRATLFQKLDKGNSAIRIETGGIVDELTDSTRLPSINEALDLLEYDFMLPSQQDSLLFHSSLPSSPLPWTWIKNPNPQMTKVNNTTVSIYGFRDDWITEESISRLQNSPPTSDIIIWLTYLEKIDPGELLVQLKNITPDLILEGNIEYTNPAPDTIQGIPVLRCGAEGMDVLEVDVFRVGEGFQFKPTWHQVDDKVEEAADVKQVLMTQKK